MDGFDKVKYPLFVTIDSNIFIACKFDFSNGSTLDLLAKNVANGKIKIVLSGIVIKEVEEHIKEAGDFICRKARDLRAEVLKKVSADFLIETGSDDVLQIPNKVSFKTKSLEAWDGFLKRLQPEMLDLKNVNLERIIDDYFASNPPFEKKEAKRYEFPDAFIVNQISERFGDAETVAIVSNDKGFMSACCKLNNWIPCSSLGELFDVLNHHDEEYEEITNEINHLLSEKVEELRSLIENKDSIEVLGPNTSPRRGDFSSDYYDFVVLEVDDLQYNVWTVDEISKENVWATVLCTAGLDVICTYDDYENAVWDRDTEAYLNAEIRHNLECHMARFGVQVKMDRTQHALLIKPFRVILNGDTRRSRESINEDEYESLLKG